MTVLHGCQIFGAHLFEPNNPFIKPAFILIIAHLLHDELFIVIISVSERKATQTEVPCSMIFE